MGCGFFPHDHDRTTKSMEGVWMGSVGCVKGVLGFKEKGVSVNSVNHWGIKRPPNGTKFDGRSTGDIPRSLGKSRPISRTFFCGSENKD